MTSPSNSAVQNLLPVQAYFDTDDNFLTFIGQGKPFYASIDPSQSGLNITNSTINSTTIGLTVPAAGAFTSFSTNTGTVATQPVGATDIVNLLALQSYAAGISWKQPCAVGTLGPITLSGLQTIDSYTTLAGDRVLVKNQANAADNGIYLASSTAWTRALDADTWNDLIAAISFIEYGTQKGGAWFCTAQPGGTLGVTPVVFAQFTTSATYTAGTGLTLTGFEFKITNTGATAGIYGSASRTITQTVNAQGQITNIFDQPIDIAATQVTSGTFNTARLSGSYTGITGVGTLTAGTWNAGTIGVAYGGTGVTTLTGYVKASGTSAFTATTTIPTTDLSGTISNAQLANSTISGVALGGNLFNLTAGTNITFSSGTTYNGSAAITINATVPAQVYPGAGIPNSTGSAWGTSYSTTGSGTVVALATSPSFTTPILGTPTSGDFSTGTFTWPTFNQNTTGTASNVTGTVAVANGGTGVTTLTGLAYGNGTSPFTAATAAQVVSVIGSTAVTNATNATNATNIGITDDTTTNATVYPVWVTTTTGNLPAKTASTKFSLNPSTGALSTVGLNLSGLTASSAVATDASKNLVSVTNTGTGNNVLATSPTINTPTINQINTSVANTSLGAGNASIMKNRIINGAMVISQYNGTSSVTPTGAAYLIDRWQVIPSQSSKLSFQQNAGSVTPPVGFTNYLGATSLSAYSLVTSDYFLLTQKIEGFNSADLGWGTANAKTVTVSFWVRSSLTGTFGFVLRNSAEDRVYPASYTISAANTWEYETITIPGDTTGTWLTTNGIGIEIDFGLGVASNISGTAGTWTTGILGVTGATSVVGTNGATFYITGVQLEVGSNATGFEYVNYQTSLANCQRYCTVFDGRTSGSYTGVGLGTWFTSSSYLAAVALPVPMRANPSATASALTIFFVDQVGGATANSFVLDQTGSTNPSTIVLGLNYTTTQTAGYAGRLLLKPTSGTITISAEL